MTDRAVARYSTVAIALHWLIAVLVIGNLAGGLLLDRLFDSPDPAMRGLGGSVIALHKSVGLTVIALTLVRLGWRLGHSPPPLPAHMTRGERLLARGSHIGFYGLLLALPLSGWAMMSTGPKVGPVSWFGLFEVPPLPLPAALGDLFHDSHGMLGWTMLALVGLHLLAVVKHRIFDRDDVLARMLPMRGR